MSELVEEKLNILIIENSIVFSNWIKTELESVEDANIIGIEKKSQDGLQAVLKNIPQIVILDLFLDGGSGLSILQSIRRLDLPVKVIVFTNHSFYRNECARLGSDYFFDKSKDFEEMIKTIRVLASADQTK